MTRALQDLAFSEYLFYNALVISYTTVFEKSKLLSEKLTMDGRRTTDEGQRSDESAFMQNLI